MAIYATTQVKPAPLGNAALVLGDKPCGIIRQVSGGAVGASVVAEQRQGTREVRKHVGPIEQEELSLDIGFAMGKPVFDWIADTWSLKTPRRDGAILACDRKLEPKSQRRFTGALITEATIPALDKSDKKSAWLNLKFAFESMRLEPPPAGKVEGDPAHPAKLLLGQNFKLEIEGLDCGKVQAIDSFTVRQIPHRAGREGLVPGNVIFPDLRITFAEVTADSWQQWLEDFILKGNHSADKEKKGALTLLSEKQQALATIQLNGLGIFKLSHAAAGSAVEEHHMLATAQLYCQRMDFQPSS